MALTDRPGPYAADVVGRLRAFGGKVVVHGPGGRVRPHQSDEVRSHLEVVERVAEACASGPGTPLALVNAAPDRWHSVDEELYRGILAAAWGHRRTGGRFDPRTGHPPVNLGARHRPARRPWSPSFHGGTLPEVHLGGQAVDLSGVAPALAARWAAELIGSSLDSFLLEIGSVTVARGRSWTVRVGEVRRGGGGAALLELDGRACATAGAGPWAGTGVRSVTVVHDDPVEAATWSQALVACGSDAIDRLVRRRRLSVLWVEESGNVRRSPDLVARVLWLAA